MNHKYNPFKPNSPVYRDMFVGREREIKRIDEILFHTKEANPTHILITGERGIGKTSLLLFVNYLSKGTVELSKDKYNFLTVQISLSKKMSLVNFAGKLESAFERELSRLNKGLEMIKKIWDFIQRIEIAGSGLKSKDFSNNEKQFTDKLMFSIVDTVKYLTSNDYSKELGFKNKKDGILILIDEAECASRELDIGTFVKSLSESLILENCNNVLIVLAGLPDICKILKESHESSLRLFEEINLSTLSEKEVKKIVLNGIEEFNKKYPNENISIEGKALENIVLFSEGYPHFVQQICYSVFSMFSGNIITNDDIINAFTYKGGALDIIGERYYKDLFFNQINVESYRQILRIMAKKWDSWISKEDIRKEFKGKSTTLDNGLKALRDRNIILSKKGIRGMYRLQWASFAFWIQYYNKFLEQK